MQRSPEPSPRQKQTVRVLALVRLLRQDRADERFSNLHLDELLRADEQLAQHERAELERPAYLRRAS